MTTTPYPVLTRRSSGARSPRHRSPARSPRAGGARSAAAVRASSSHGAAPGPGGASRPAAPAPGANCQGSKARVRRAPLAPPWLRTHTHVAVQVGRARPAPWGTLVNQVWPFVPACILADPSCTLTGAGIQELTVRRGARPRNPARKPWPHAHLHKQPSTLTEARAPPQKQPCSTLSHCEHTSNPAGTIHPACTPTETAVHTHRLLPARSLTLHVHAACTLSAPPALTAHTATHAPQCAPRLPSRSAEPRPPASGHELPPRLHLRPHPSGALRHLAWRRPQPILGARKGDARSPPPRGRICSRAAGRPPFKASRLPSPPPSRRGLGPHPGDCAGAWGLHMPGRSAGHWSKSLREVWASGAAEPGAPAGRARTGRRAR